MVLCALCKCNLNEPAHDGSVYVCVCVYMIFVYIYCVLNPKNTTYLIACAVFK